MNKSVLYDTTTYDLSGLSNHFNLSKDDILNFFMKVGAINADAQAFFSYFNISNNNILEKDIYLTSLHVTTVNDQLASINKFGLLNLQDAVTYKTPLKKYLLEKGVSIDIKRKVIDHKGKLIDISAKYDGNLYHTPLHKVIYKLFIDYPITSFFSTKNVTNYEGKVHERPEFLKNLAELLNSPDINNDWKKRNECYVIKYRSHIDNFSNMSFRMNIYEPDCSEEVDLQKRIWIIDKTLENQRYGYEDTCYSHLKENVIIPSQDFLSTYTLAQYKQAYKIL